MIPLNSNLLSAAQSPIMEVGGWVRDTPLPEGLDLIDLSQAAPALPPPHALREAIADAVLNEPKAHFYGPVLGNTNLREALAVRTQAIYGGNAALDNVAITAGCNQAFCVAVTTACAPGDAVALPVPWYFNHKMWLDMAGLEAVPLAVGHDMLPDPDAVRSLPPHVKAVALVSPNNPTGTEYPDAVLSAFFEACRESGRLLIVDETYRDFHSGSGAPHTLFQRPEWSDVLVHLYSFSKAFRLTGHRTGAMIAGADRIRQAEKFLDTVTICPAQSGQIAAHFGLQNLTQFVAAEREVYLSRRLLLERLMTEELPEWNLHGAGAYFAWVSPPYGLESKTCAQTLLRQTAVLALPGSMFMPEGQRSEALRLAFANADETGIAETVRRLAAFRP